MAAISTLDMSIWRFSAGRLSPAKQPLWFICTPAGEGEVTTPVAEEVDDDVDDYDVATASHPWSIGGRKENPRLTKRGAHAPSCRYAM